MSERTTNDVFPCHSGEGRKRSQLSFPATSEYVLGGKDTDLTNMVGVLKTPNGSVEPSLLKKTSAGQLGKYSFSNYLLLRL